jgi:hypothetical protein
VVRGELTAKQAAFCREYAKHGNGSRAARDAGYGPSSAKTQAVNMLKLPKIQERIDLERRKLLASRPLDRELVMGEIAQLAMGDSLPPRDKLRALEMLAKFLGASEVVRVTPTDADLVKAAEAEGLDPAEVVAAIEADLREGQ